MTWKSIKSMFFFSLGKIYFHDTGSNKSICMTNNHGNGIQVLKSLLFNNDVFKPNAGDHDMLEYYGLLLK